MTDWKEFFAAWGNKKIADPAIVASEGILRPSYETLYQAFKARYEAESKTNFCEHVFYHSTQGPGRFYTQQRLDGGCLKCGFVIPKGPAE